MGNKLSLQNNSVQREIISENKLLYTCSASARNVSTVTTDDMKNYRWVILRVKHTRVLDTVDSKSRPSLDTVSVFFTCGLCGEFQVGVYDLLAYSSISNLLMPCICERCTENSEQLSKLPHCHKTSIDYR